MHAASLLHAGRSLTLTVYAYYVSSQLVYLCVCFIMIMHIGLFIQYRWGYCDISVMSGSLVRTTCAYRLYVECHIQASVCLDTIYTKKD